MELHKREKDMTEHRKKILIVEDDKAIIEILKVFLKGYAEYEVYIARDARSAMNLLNESEGVHFDAIFLDIMMPYGTPPALEELKSSTDPEELETGLRLLRWLREIRGEETVWVAVITARAFPRVAAEAQSLLKQRGCIYFKPFDNLRIEHDLATSLGVPSKVPPELQPGDYTTHIKRARTMEKITFAIFEGFSRRVYKVMWKIHDENSLLRQGCALLEAGVGILVERIGSGETVKRKIMRSWSEPPTVTTVTEAEQNILWDWFAAECDMPGIEGFTKEASIRLGSRDYPDALVAFGASPPTDESPAYELVLLQHGEAKVQYSSYQCWVAKLLLSQFEYHNNVKLLDATQRTRNLFSDAFTLDALPQESWESLKFRVEKLPVELRGRFHVIWAGYQQRMKRANSSPLDWPLEVINEWKGRKDLFGQVCLAVVNENDLNETCTSLKQSLFGESAKTDLRERKQLVQASLVFLEHAWKKIRHWTEPRRSSFQPGSVDPALQKPELPDKVTIVRNLLSQTRALAIEGLCYPAGSSSPQEKKARVGKEFRWLYLAAEIATPCSKLEQLYLYGDRHNEYRTAAPELRRQFLLQLTRFMLGVVGRLQEANGIRWKSTLNMPQPVTPVEELDGLVFMVDRFGHVELGVEERLAIRHHLARQVHAEIGHYMSRNHYRDHLLHVIDVFLLGYLLLNTELTWIESARKPLSEHLNSLSSKDNKLLGRVEDWLRNWAIASLLHDIAYQINLSKDGKAWNEYFKLPGGVPFRIQSNTEGVTFTPESQVDFVRELGRYIASQDEMKDVLADHGEEALRDHGVLSALRVGQLLSLPWGSEEALNSLKRNREALHAIACHNLGDTTLHFERHPLACLLRLCDELQEWGRNRINLEKMMKHLYLDLQEGELSKFPSYKLVDFIDININLAPKIVANIPAGIKAVLREADSNSGLFRFDLLYHDSVMASFDATRTLLSKAYNLQRLDFHYSTSSQWRLGVMLSMQFPKPFKYGRLMEYDILAMFAEECRGLPLLREYDQMQPESPGLVRLAETSTEAGIRCDHFGIVRVGKPNSTNAGWLDTNPENLFNAFDEFKKNMLRERGTTDK